MKTVQEWLNGVDENKLSGTCLFKFPVDYTMIPDKGLTLGSIQDELKSRFIEFIHQIPGSVLILQGSWDIL